MKIKKINENFESSKIEIFSDSGKSVDIGNDDIIQLLDVGLIWQDDEDYSFRDEDYWSIQQMVNGYGSANEGKVSKFDEIFKEV